MKIIECPRDAMQGIDTFIPTSEKVRYINQLLRVGFDTIDFGSFVSPKAIPQMKDTVAVLTQLEPSSTKLLAIVANVRGAQEAGQCDAITYLGFPLSISHTFQQRNTNKSIPQALNELQEIKAVCTKHGKQLVVYISMAFGNPYGDPYGIEVVEQFTSIVITLGADVVSLADTTGMATAAEVSSLFTRIAALYPDKELGAHLHATPHTAVDKIRASVEAGCKRLDGALKGYGGCPMAQDDLTGNVPTEKIVEVLASAQIEIGLNKEAFAKAMLLADEIFPKH